MMLLASLLIGCVVASQDRSEIGYGAKRLRNFRSKNVLQATTTCENVEEFYFKDAVLDNFSPIDHQKKWEGEGQRYWLNKQFWGGPGAPIFVYIGGEGQESCSRLTDHMYAFELAKEYNALLVNVEHRFYGESYPTLDMSTDNLQYLSSAQALADLARIIGFVKGDLISESSKVITIGGSYPGNLAAWFRLKYPSVSSGSIASSAPLTAQTNFPEYMEVVGQSLVYFSGQDCYNQFEEAANAVGELGHQGAGSEGWAQLDKDFATCSPMNEVFDLAVLYSDVMGNVQGTVQYNNEHNGVMNVTDICAVMTGSEGTAYDRFVTLSAMFREVNGQECEDASMADTIDYLSAVEKDPTNAGRPWTYQTCNEFGYYQTTDSKSQPFHAWEELNLAFSRAICFGSFNGWTRDPQVEWMNEVYGDRAIAGTNIALVAGTIDPWHALGVTNYTTPVVPQPTEVPVYILGTAHCNDLYAPANSDPPSLTYAREVINGLVAKWLA